MKFTFTYKKGSCNVEAQGEKSKVDILKGNVKKYSKTYKKGDRKDTFMKISRKVPYGLFIAFILLTVFWYVQGSTNAADRVIPGSGIVITPDGIKVDTQRIVQEKMKEIEKAREEAAKAEPEADEETKGSKKEAAENVHVTTVCPPGSTAKVDVGKDGSVKDSAVVTKCVEGGEARVNVGSEHIADKKKVKDTVIKRNVSGTAVSTVTGKGGKSSVDVGSVTIR